MEKIKLLPTAEKKIDFVTDLLQKCEERGRHRENQWHWDGYLLELQYTK